MPHISKDHPLVGHGQKGGKEGGAVDREFKSRPRGHAYINFGDEEDNYYHRGNTKSNICEEGGDCADRVNEE